MIANVVHTSLNAAGGAERLAVATIKTLSSMGIDVELETAQMPVLGFIHEAFGEGIDNHLAKIQKLELFRKNDDRPDVITINTHGDILPLFRKHFTKQNSIVYCHYPVGWQIMNQAKRRNSELESLIDYICPTQNNDRNISRLCEAYRNMMLSSTILTNSEFSRKAIFQEFGVESTVLPPPVQVDVFRDACLSSGEREDTAIVLSRFHPSKEVENAIRLAGHLKKEAICKSVKIVGNMFPANIEYFRYLQSLARKSGLEDFVTLETNVSFNRLLNLMAKSKVYFHPTRGEPFGISTVEAMSAGLIPVVPHIGGHTEFVPKRYQFHSLHEAAELVHKAMNAPTSERVQLSLSTQRYSSSNFMMGLREIVARHLAIDTIQRPSQILASKPNLG